MLRYAESPEVLLADIAHEIASVRDPRARHWLVTPGRGRSEHILNQWAKHTGIASHAQEIGMRTLLDQIAAGTRKCFDFDALRLAVATALESLREHAHFPFPKNASVSPVTATVLAWATSLARAMDEALQCRQPDQAWESGSFLESLARTPEVQRVLESHPSLLTTDRFLEAARLWMAAWNRKGGVPYLWIQLDAGMPQILFTRLQELLQFFSTEGLSQRIRLFAIVPSEEFWGEQLIRSRNRRSGLPAPDAERHPGGLLWALGRCSQDFQCQIIEPLLSEGSGGTRIPSPPCPESLLGKLQESCRRSSPPEQRHLLAEDDFSLSVHSAHNPLRELEICRDRILQALEELPNLRAEEVLVLLANPKEQSLFVEAAFGGGAEVHLPFRLLGFGQAIPSPFAAALQLLTNVLGARITLSDIQQLLEHPLVARRFELDVSKGEPKQIVEWMQDAGFRWGVNAEHRGSIHTFEEHRWNLSWAVQRLGLGGIVAQESLQEPVGTGFQDQQTIPLERASGLGLALLAKLAAFLESLEQARSSWIPGIERSLNAWNAALEELMESFLSIEESSTAAHSGTLRNSILPALLRASGEELHLETGAYLALVHEKLQNLNDSANRGSGGIRVGDLRQMSGVPARLIVVAGLNCGSFPRSEDRAAWHPLSGAARPGDPSARDADRHALLLALLSAGERLVLTYCGNSDEDQKERPPSTALADILEAIDSTATTADPTKPAHRAILHHHSLNGFSPRAFSPGGHRNVQGYAPADYQAALQLLRRDELNPYPGPWTTLLPEDEAARPTLEDLRTLFREPARLFLRRLGIRPPEERDEVPSLDLIELDTLQNWGLRNELLIAQLEGFDGEKLEQRLELSGSLPRGALGRAALEKIKQELPQTGRYSVGDRVATTCQIRLPVDGPQESTWLLEGLPRPGWYQKAGHPAPRYYSASNFIAKSSWKQELQFRVDALAIIAALQDAHGAQNASHTEPPEVQSSTHIEGIFRDEALSIPMPSSKQAAQLLEQLVPLYHLARRLPLPFWPDAFRELDASEGATPEAQNRALELAHVRWMTPPFNSGQPPECQATATRIAFRGMEDPMAWNPPVEAAFLPDPGAPLAWRIARFVREWVGTLPTGDTKGATTKKAGKRKS
jgi:exonuclease V gamma subunit